MAHINKFELRDWDDFEIEAEDAFMDSSKYSTPENESDKRKQLQTQHTQIREFINDIVVEKINEIDDTQGQIQTNYALKSESGKTLTISYSALNNNTITYGLLAADGTTLLASGTISLNLGKYITGISYDAPNKRLVITSTTNGASSTEYVSLSAILTGYATEVWCNGKFETIANCNSIRDRITVLETFKNTTVPSTYATKDELNTHKNNTSNPHAVTKAQVGLGNVDNTSDMNKPVSTAMQAALDKKTNILEAGAFIILEQLPNGHVRVSAANGEISIDYRNATNKPFINNVELVGNKSFDDLGLPLSVVNGKLCVKTRR